MRVLALTRPRSSFTVKIDVLRAHANPMERPVWSTSSAGAAGRSMGAVSFGEPRILPIQSLPIQSLPIQSLPCLVLSVAYMGWEV